MKQIWLEVWETIPSIIAATIATLFHFKVIYVARWGEAPAMIPKDNFTLFKEIVAWMVAFDIMFYSTHRYILHSKALYKYVHAQHHLYTKPTAFCILALHPLETQLFTLSTVTSTFLVPSSFLTHGICSTFMVIFGMFSHDSRMLFGAGGHFIVRSTSSPL